MMEASYQENLLSSSLKSREPWSSLAIQLLASNPVQWMEADRTDCDLTCTRISGHLGISLSYRFLLLTPSAVDQSTTATKIEQLYLSDRGRNAAIIFLLDSSSTNTAMQAYMKIQADMIEGNLPTLPLLSLSSASLLPSTLTAFLASSETAQNTPSFPPDTTRDLLPHCSISQPLSNTTTTTLTNTTFSFRDLLREISTDEGRSSLEAAVGVREAHRLVSFWMQEFVA